MKTFSIEQIFDFYDEYKDTDETVYLTCPNCNKKYTMYFADLKMSSADLSEEYTTRFISYICPECNEIIVFYQASEYDVAFDRVEIIDTQLLLPKETNVVEKKWPNYVNDKIIKDYQKTVSVIDIAPDLAVSNGRKALERIILAKWPDVVNVERKYEDRLPDLADMVRYVKKNKLYDDYDLLEQIKNIGNNSIHIFNVDKDINISRDDAKLVLSIIELLINELFVKPEERSELKTKIAALAKNTKIEKNELENETMNVRLDE